MIDTTKTREQKQAEQARANEIEERNNKQIRRQVALVIEARRKNPTKVTYSKEGDFIPMAAQ